MHMVMFAYTAKAFCQFLLPAVDNTDISFVLKKSIYEFEDDLVLEMEVAEGRWFLKPSETYTAVKRKGSGTEYFADGDIVMLEEQGRNEVSLLFQAMESVFPVLEKYDLTSLQGLYIGSDGTQSHIVYQYQSLVSKKHAMLRRGGDGFQIVNLSSNGTFVNGRNVDGSRNLAVGDVINIFGLKIVYLGNMIAVSSPASVPFSVASNVPVYVKMEEIPPVRDKFPEKVKKFFHRSPRNYMQLETDAIEIEAPPAPKEEDKKPLWMVIGPSFTMMLPMMAGSAMMIYSASARGGGASPYMFTGIITAVGSAVIGVFWALSNIRYNKKSLIEAEERRFNAYGNYLVNRADYIKNQYEKSRNTLLSMYPGANEVVKYTEQSSQLWNRNRKHEDFLSHRLGLGSMDFQMNIQVPKEKFTLISDELSDKPQAIKEDYSVLYNVPVNVNLLEHKLIGIVGGEGKRGAFSLVRLLTAQIAASNCYTDIKLVYVFQKDHEEEDWEYVKWLPHVWSEDKKVRYIAADRAEASDIFFELTQIFRMRMEDEEEQNQGIILPKPYYILFVSDVELLNGELITKYMYECNPCCGLTSFILTESLEQLPNECEFVLQNDQDFSGIHDLSTNEEIPVVYDSVFPNELERFARLLLPIEVKEVEKGRDIPESVTFFEMHGVNRLEDFHVEDRWRKSRNYENMRAMIGVKGGGVPCYLDVHEKYHGPHGLVAGTTGSGKSETLQTYMLSLAIEFSPDDIAYFVIDYKGGGMAGLFDGLPHMAGSISNLSGNQVRRAMVSIKSENRRRQKIFNDNNVNNINLYTRLYKSGQAKTPIPHLFIIIDEFAELKREEPEFMKELISVAQVGRSLGVHLILATQKPSGTVDDNIWSNSKFRLCLRVQDRQDSKDMLHKPDAAFITQAGRGYLQVGNDEVYELFQSGYSGASYEEDGYSDKTETVSMISNTGRTAYVSAGKKRKKADSVKDVTQLDAVIDYLRQVAGREGYGRQMQLWMPLLPEVLYLAQLNAHEEIGFQGGEWTIPQGKWNMSTPVGLCDDPVNQAQFPLYIDFAKGGHLAVVGSIVSGKSTFMQSLLYALIHKYSPDWLNLYILDFSSQMQGCFENAPHTGGVMFEDDMEKIGKFFHMLERILTERKKMFRGGNYAQYVQVKGVVVPVILIAIDNYGAFREKTDNKFDERMLRIVKEGVGYGIYVVISAGGFSTAEIPTKMGDNIKTVVCLQMNDKFAYADAIRQNHLEVLPESNIKGRGLAMAGEVPLEFQTALALPAEDDFSRGEEIRKLAVHMAESWKGRKAKQVPVIPEKPVWAEFEKLDDVAELQKSYRYLPVGYDMSSADIYSIDLSKTYVYLVSGRARTGKTTVLKSIIRSAAAKEGKVYVFEHGSIDLKTTAEKTGAGYVDSVSGQAEFFADLLEPFVARNKKKRALLEEGKDDLEIYEAMQGEIPYFIVIADIVPFIQSVYHREAGVREIYKFVENIAEKGKLHNIYFFFGINPDTVGSVIGQRAYKFFTEYHMGIHLGGNVGSIRYFDYTNIPFTMQSKPQKAGTGLLPAGNEDAAVQVVLPNVKG